MNLSLLYVRVSSKEQEKEGFSLDAQEKLGYDYAHRRNFKIKKIWKVSESAWHEERTAFNQMVEYAKRHLEVKHIIFDVTDRMTRNDFDKLKIYTLIKEYDKTIHFSRTNKVFNKNSGPDDEFMFDIEVAVAKKMSNDISKKTKMGMLEKAEQGLYPSVAPIGYKNNIITHLIEVDEERGHYIKKGFSLMATGLYSLYMLENKLYEAGFRGLKGKRIGKSTLFVILKNPVYYGAFNWKGKLYQGSHIPIIGKELFDKVQNILNGGNRPSVHKLNFAFNNLATCGICNCKVIAEKKKNKYTYYHCTFSKGRHEKSNYVSEKRLSIMLEGPIKAVTLDKKMAEWLKEALKESKKDILRLQEKRSSSLKNQQDKINNRLSKLYDMKIDSEISDDIFKAKENEYQGQLIEIISKLDSSRAINPNFYEDGCKTLELSNRLYSLYVKANYEEKAKIARLVASNYSLNDVSLYPTYRKPFSLFAKRASRLTWLPLLDEFSNWLNHEEITNISHIHYQYQMQP